MKNISKARRGLKNITKDRTTRILQVFNFIFGSNRLFDKNGKRNQRNTRGARAWNVILST
jgi:hypothetical protein